MFRIFKFYRTLGVVLTTMSMQAATVNAADWMFQRSYYTHDPVAAVRVGPQAPSGGPYYSRVQGEFTQSGLRQLRSSIRVGGVVNDNYMTWEGWVQRGLQY